MTKTLSKFQLKLNNAVLRIDVNTDALDLSSTPLAQVYSSLQQHITKLQVKCFTSMLMLICYIGENNQLRCNDD